MAAAADMYLPSDPSDPKRWICIYPSYLNSRRSIPEGRKIPKDKAVDNPTCAEIRDVCISLGLNCDVEMNKHYCRDLSRDPTFAGRVRVQLRNADGSPSSEQFPHRKALYQYIGSMIPKLKSRISKQGQATATVEDTLVASQQPKKKKGKKRK
ncbi:signal recognition particle 19 kDa protein-like [Corticium candelabrum]|uniref:signal recognition particle 19 kDa protein-like n=1 Tax=Corticium candelabrum TaxID=121492 RepID=UPI002E25FE13|nr:signal recognition particle 19 kDa protein-like [Corticium candelabrum]